MSTYIQRARKHCQITFGRIAGQATNISCHIFPFWLGSRLSQAPMECWQPKTIKPDDLFIASFPKSGNTWLRFLLAKLHWPNREVSFSTINQLVPDLYRHSAYINSEQERPRMIKTHTCFFSPKARYVYVYRDGRDVAVSLHKFRTNMGIPEVSLSQFLREDWDHVCGSWSKHIERALTFHAKHPERMLCIKYEALLANPMSELERLTAFCNLNISSQQLADTIDFCSFQSLRNRETTHKRGFMPKGHFFRSGTAGQWRTLFTEADHKGFLIRHGHMLKTLGYELS